MELDLKRYTSAVKRITTALADLLSKGENTNGWNTQQKDDSALANKIWYEFNCRKDYHGNKAGDLYMNIRRLDYVYGTNDTDYTLYLCVVDAESDLVYFTLAHALPFTIYDTTSKSFCILVNKRNLISNFVYTAVATVNIYKEMIGCSKTEGKYGKLLDEILPMYYSIDAAITNKILEDEEKTFKELAQKKAVEAMYVSIENVKTDELVAEVSKIYSDYMEELLSEKQDPILNDRWFYIYVNKGYMDRYSKYVF